MNKILDKIVELATPIGFIIFTSAIFLAKSIALSGVGVATLGGLASPRKILSIEGMY